MTTKTTKHEVLIDEAEQQLQSGKYAKVANLVWQAAFGATQEAAAKRGLGCNNMAETLKTAAALDQICPSTLLPYDDALASAECFEFQAATRGQGGDWEWNPEEYQENLNCVRHFIRDLERIQPE